MRVRILLIEDSPTYAEAFAALLADAGLPDVILDHADGAEAGARLMARGEHDIYFVDYRLPGARGTALIEASRRAGVTRPMFCLTGMDLPLLDREAEQAGATFHLSKDGLTPALLGRTIRFALRNAAATAMPPDAAERFRIAQDAANIGTWEWNAVSSSMAWDSQMYQLFGCDPERCGSACNGCQRQPRPEAFAAIEQRLAECIATGDSFRSDFAVTRRDGSVHAIRAAGRPIRDAAGRTIRVSGLCWDITEIRDLVSELAQARDAAERANRAKSRFLTGISHELRTPMNAILGNAQLLRREGGLSAAQEARVERMLDAGGHLLELIHCVLDLSEIETGQVVLQAEAVDVRVLAGGCLAMVRSLAEENGLSLHLTVAGDVPLLVLADATRLRQILLNLLGNAVKFTASGGIDLRVRCTSDGARLRFDVADTGPGIPAEKRALLFQEFGRLEDGAWRAEEGAGLGLALSWRLAALLGGAIGHLDNPGGGSVFWFEISLVAAPDAAAGAVQEGSAAGAPGRRLRVLVVDDSEMNLDVAASFLRVLGHGVRCCGGGAEAVDAVSAEAFDVVLMDVQMPGMDGLEAARRIRALPGAAGRVPVVALTAQVFTDQVAACRAAGMTAHLAKPFTEATLYAVLAQVVPGAPPERRNPGESWAPEEAALPVLDMAIFDANTRLLQPGSVIRYLDNIMAGTDALLAQLRCWNAAEAAGDDMLKAAHKLAGNVGVLGFMRASLAARAFERAASTGAADAPALCSSLIEALVLSRCAVKEKLDDLREGVAGGSVPSHRTLGL